jgi:hypothetical protein
MAKLERGYELTSIVIDGEGEGKPVGFFSEIDELLLTADAAWCI